MNKLQEKLLKKSTKKAEFLLFMLTYLTLADNLFADLAVRACLCTGVCE